MGWRFYRRIKIAPGITLNASKSGLSMSFGVRGAKHTIGPRGSRTTLGLPGTGLSYTFTESSSRANDRKAVEEAKASMRASVAEMDRVLANLDSDFSETNLPEPALPQKVPRLGFFERLRTPKAELAFLDAFIALEMEDKKKALRFARESVSEPDGELLTAILAIYSGLEDEAVKNLSSAMKKPARLGNLYKKYNPPFLLTLPIFEDVNFYLFDLSLETALLISAAIAEDEGRFADAANYIKEALTLTKYYDVLKAYYTKLLVLANPGSEQTINEVRELRYTLDTTAKAQENVSEEVEVFRGEIRKILREHHQIITKPKCNGPSPSKNTSINLPDTPFFERILQNKNSSSYGISVFVGTSDSQPKAINLDKNNNILIIGDAGSGKTTLLHSIILGTVWCYPPTEVQIILADSRRIEFSVYKQIPHILFEISYDKKNFLNVLNDLKYESELRLEVLRQTKSRSVEQYNNKLLENDLDNTSHHKINKIIFVIDNIDEFLTDSVSGNVATTILDHILDLSRICGIHFIISTTNLNRIIPDPRKFQSKIILSSTNQHEIEEALLLPSTKKVNQNEFLVFDSTFNSTTVCSVDEISDLDIETVCSALTKPNLKHSNRLKL